MRLIHKNQKGFTLIELLVAVAITGIITGGITVAIFQVFTGNARTSNHMTAVSQVQNAGYWISRDAQMAQDVDTDDNPGTPELELVTLTWTEWSGGEHTATYTLEDEELWRDYDGQRSLVAQYLVPGSGVTSLNFTGDVLTLTVTASVGGDWQEASETRVYEVIPRPSPG